MWTRTAIDSVMQDAARRGFMVNQSPGELAVAYEQIWNTGAGTVVEIGVQHGGWLWAVRSACTTPLKCIAVSLAFSTGWPTFKTLLTDSGATVLEIQGSSLNGETLGRVQAGLEGRPIDVLHIDGSHKAADVLQDYDLYSPLVRPGGLILMHDICGSQGPGTAFNTIVKSDRTGRIAELRTICDSYGRPENQRMGIAMIRVR